MWMPVDPDVLGTDSTPAVINTSCTTWAVSTTCSNLFLSGSRSITHQSGLSGFCIVLFQGLNSIHPRDAIYNKVASSLQSIKFLCSPSETYGNFGIQSGTFPVTSF